jgi:hypothetical protein
MCKPIRTRTSVPPGHGWDARARWATHCGLYSVLGAWEGDEAGVSLGAHLMPAPTLKSTAEQPSLVCEDLRIALAEVLEEARGPLDVGEEEGDCPGR